MYLSVYAVSVGMYNGDNVQRGQHIYYMNWTMYNRQHPQNYWDTMYGSPRNTFFTTRTYHLCIYLFYLYLNIFILFIYLFIYRVILFKYISFIYKYISV